MEIIPAIDLRGGHCVRLRQGKESRIRDYSSDPIAVARLWVSQGARRLHIVNLDGAFGRESGNLEVMRSIASELKVSIQYGGGLRKRESIATAFDAGAKKVVLGTVALSDPLLLKETVAQFGADRIIVAIDTTGGVPALKGWTEMSEKRLASVLADLHTAGVEEVLHTDIQRDGMMSGPDLDTLKFISGMGFRVIASGGISGIDDIRQLTQMNISGAIIGTALYEGKLRLVDLMMAL